MFEQLETINQALLQAMDRYADWDCFRIKQGGRYHSIAYAHFRELTFRMARFFQDQGISEGERVVIASYNCLEWMVAYVATLFVGGVAIPLRHSLASETFLFTLQDSGAAIVVLDEAQLSTAFLPSPGTEDQSPLPGLKLVLTIGDSGASSADASVAAILNEAAPLRPEEQKAIRDAAGGVSPESLAVIYYTAGESGRPKGAVFDHARLVRSLRHLADCFPLNDEDIAFTVIPWSYQASLNVSLHYFLSGVANVLAENDDMALENMGQTSPTVTLNMPYFLGRLHDDILSKISRMPESSREVFHWAVAKGREFKAAGSAASDRLREAYGRADLTFFSQIRGRLGGRMRRFYSVGAPLSEHLAQFFDVIGLPVLDIYSLTEAGGFPTISRLAAHRPGSCGQVAPGFEICITDDNEVLVRSQTIMSGYWGWPTEMYQVLDPEGWLHTGDLGRFDEDGYLYLSGRKQPFMVLSTGRKIMPDKLEETLSANPLIAQAVVFGEGRPYISALIVPDMEALVGYFQEHGGALAEADSLDDSVALKWVWPRDVEECEPLTTDAHAMVKAMLDRAVAEVNRTLAPWEQIRKYTLIDQAHSETANELVELIAGGRYLVAERYAAQIEAMYPPAPLVGEKEVTHVGVSPERLRELLEKESILDAWLADAGIEFLFKLARTKQIDVPSMVHICDVVATIAQTESEEKPLSTAIIVGDPVHIARVLQPSQIQLLRHDHIRRLRHLLVTLSRIVDGLVLGYVVDKHGYLRGVHKLSEVVVDEHSANNFLGPQFRRHAAISNLCDAVVFFVPRGGRQARVFANGQLIGRYSNGDWSPENISQVNEIISRLAIQKQYDLVLVQRILQCAFQMSEENLGAIFVIGDADTILEQADAPEISHFALIVSTNMSNLSDQELINFAKQDGATVIDVKGKFRGCMVLLRPGAGTQAEIGPGKGARHSSAAKMSAEADCLAIAVSQDGPVTVYDSGRRVLSI